MIDGRVDFDASVRRELEEETGLDANELDWDPGWYGVRTDQRFPLFKIARAKENAATLRERILTNLATQREPEFTDVYLVRNVDDIRPEMPLWMKVFLEYFWNPQSILTPCHSASLLTPGVSTVGVDPLAGSDDHRLHDLPGIR